MSLGLAAAPGAAASSQAPCRRVLMTVDAVGGVWRYALDLASGLGAEGIEVVFAGLGARPSAAQMSEAEAAGELVWFGEPLDWMASDEGGLDALPERLERLARDRAADVIQVNAPSQAAGISPGLPVVAVSHSCVTTWWETVRGGGLPEAWRWQKARNRAGFARADAVVAPSASHAALLRRCYGDLAVAVVPNGVTVAAEPPGCSKQPFAQAAARWWDEAKNASLLDAAACGAAWPVHAAGATRGPNGAAVAFRHVHALGPLAHADLLAILRRAAVFVSPSLYEPFGLAAVEAARLGAALVLADIPTYRELWSGCATFFDPRDPDALRHALDTLANDPLRRTALAARARRHSRRFSARSHGVAMARIFRSLVASPALGAEA